MKLGVRDEVETWMRKRDIMILGLTETRSKQNTRESRKQYTWFFSGEGGRPEVQGGDEDEGGNDEAPNDDDDMSWILRG